MKISVAMTTYNGALYLREQLDSILAQSRLPDELIVCDDQSTDATPSILEEYAARSPFAFKVRINDTRLGSTKNFEQAIGLCTGDIICLSDQDDVWHPQKLAVIQQRFEEDAELDLVFTNGDLIDGDGMRMRADMWKAFRFSSKMQRILGIGGAYDLLLSWPFITGATVAFRSRNKDLVLPIPDEMPTFVHDRWIAVLIAAVGKIGLIEERLIAYRLHRNQQIGTGKSLRRRFVTPHRASSDKLALAAIRERLSTNAEWSAKPEFDHALQLREEHIVARTALPQLASRRLGPIALEYASGRYHRYPWVIPNLVRDLIVGTE